MYLNFKRRGGKDHNRGLIETLDVFKSTNSQNYKTHAVGLIETLDVFK